MSFLKKIFGGGEDKDKVVPPKHEGVDLGEILEQVKQAKVMQVQFGQSQQQMNTADLNQLMAMATGNAELLTGQSAEPRTQFVKKTTCHNCGAAKTLAPKTAYVYCDFCGSLTDYDFQKACQNPNAAMPGPEYMELVRQTNADAQLARETKDKDKFYEIQSRLFDRWIELCPNAVSPRAKKDADYRAKLVEYMAKTALVNEFDPTYQQYAQKVKEETAAIQWEGMYPKPLASGATFWPLYQTVKEQLEYSYKMLGEQGILDLHPDGAPESLQRRMTWSMFCQGWLPVLAEADSEKMIADAGLKGEYSKLEPVETTLRHCGGCGGELHSLPGAKVMVCEDCGTSVDVGNPEVNCKNCAGSISFPAGQNRVQCPFCKSEAQRMSW